MPLECLALLLLLRWYLLAGAPQPQLVELLPR